MRIKIRDIRYLPTSDSSSIREEIWELKNKREEISRKSYKIARAKYSSDSQKVLSGQIYKKLREEANYISKEINRLNRYVKYADKEFALVRGFSGKIYKVDTTKDIESQMKKIASKEASLTDTDFIRDILEAYENGDSFSSESGSEYEASIEENNGVFEFVV